jgi:TPR repeat protein
MNAIFALKRTVVTAALVWAASMLLPCSNAQQGNANTSQLTILRAKADKGDAQSQLDLGVAFCLGKFSLATNYVEAATWFRRAAEQNFAAAQANLGVCFERGDGVAKYEVEAYKWDLLAAAQGDTKGKRNATMLELMLSGEDIAEGKQRADAWLEQRKKPSPNNR